MASCVDDARVMLGVLQDRRLLAAPHDRQAPNLGLVDEFFMAWAEEPVQAAIESALETFRAAGATIRPVSLPASFTLAGPMHRRVIAHGAAETHREWFTSHAAEYSPLIAGLIREGLAISAADLQEARNHQQRFSADMAAMFAGGEASGSILIMPSTMTPPPLLGEMGDPRFNAPWTYSGVPVVTIPCGRTDDGLPIGLQLVGPHNDEQQLLVAAAWCEKVLGTLGHPSFAAGS
jgi:Asp-tRNA(Asn)/Glu-tRNA(Gln) amidotransferase A subunit family amidase